MNKIKIGILFGGSSREREVSFAGGRTVYDNLDKSLFEPIPIFIDSLHNFILLDWQYIYKGTIRDFYPPTQFIQQESYDYQYYIENLGKLSDKENDTIANSVGKKIHAEKLHTLFDFAFLCLHGTNGEDGKIQGLLEYYKIPYSGSGIFASAFGMNKALQKKFMKANGFNVPNYLTIERHQFEKKLTDFFDTAQKEVKFPLVIKPANQGSSIGVSILKEDDKHKFYAAIEKAFFKHKINADTWNNLSPQQKINLIRTLSDIRENIGLPALVEGKIIYEQEVLLNTLNEKLSKQKEILIESLDAEQEVLVEAFLDGKEFSCIVIEDDTGNPIALPPTEILKKNTLFDYKSKYLPGLSRKITPIDLPEHQIEEIRTECEKMFQAFNFDVYARIDGFIDTAGKIFLNDPNTTSGMMPSSFFFHQAAEIGLNPSQFLTLIIRSSLQKRHRQSLSPILYNDLLQNLDTLIHLSGQSKKQKIRVAVIMGGFSSERHISVESGRNVFEKLSSSEKYQPFPVFLVGTEEKHELYTIPIRLMLKDNADDIRDKIFNYKVHPIIQKVVEEAKNTTQKYGSASSLDSPKKITYEELSTPCDVVFIALHGRPGEDGVVQKNLEAIGLPYNGSGHESSNITINKFATNEILKQNDILVAEHKIINQSEWQSNTSQTIEQIEKQFKYPFIVKPVDDGCSSGVKKIKNRDELQAYAQVIFRTQDELPVSAAQLLKIKPNEEVPAKNRFLLEALIEANGAARFLEVTGGMLIKKQNGKKIFEVFEPSEALVEGEVLSLEEKFLAGEGQNITPSRFSKKPEEQKKISEAVKKVLQHTADVMNIEGYCRIDAFVRIYTPEKIEVIIIEINSLPGMTPATCIYHQAAINNYKPYQFIDAILTEALNRKLKVTQN